MFQKGRISGLTGRRPAALTSKNSSAAKIATPMLLAGTAATPESGNSRIQTVPPAGGPEAKLTTWAATEPTMPNVSTLNYYGSVVANPAIVPAGTNEAINVYVDYATDVLFDANGYFAPAQTSGLYFYPLQGSTPTGDRRRGETRFGQHVVGPHG